MQSQFKSFLLTSLLLLTSSHVFAQNDESRNGIELFRKGSYKESVAALQKAVKASPQEARAHTFLGLAQIKLGKMKDAEKSLVRGLELNPNQPDARKALAYVYLLRDKLREVVKHISILKAAGALDAEAFYIFGWAHLRLGNSDEALDCADQAVRLDPKMANAYLLKAHALMTRPDEALASAEIAARYGGAADNIGKFITLADAAEKSFWRGQQETLKAFAVYYAGRGKSRISSGGTQVETNVVPLKILAKPRARYTDQARQAGIGGTIRLLVAFSETGKITDILVLSGLGYGLDTEAIRAARGIKFEPERRAGVAVTSVKMLEYSFSIY